MPITYRASARLALCAAALALTAQIANAVPVTSTQSFSGSKSNQFTRSLNPTIPLTGSIVNFGSSLGVFDLTPKFQANKFDANLGTLLSVQIIYDGAFDGSNRISIISSNCTDTGFINSSCATKSVSADYMIDFGVFLQIGSVDEVSTNRSTTISNQNTSFLNGPSDLLAQTTLTSASDLAAYSGAGTFDLTPFFFPTIDPSLTCRPSTATVLFSCNARLRAFYQAQYDVSVVFTYDDGTVVPPPPPPTPTIPLPAGAPLLLAGLAAFGLLRRRA